MRIPLFCRLLFAASFVPALLLPQPGTGQIRGRVADSSGAPVSGAVVIVTPVSAPGKPSETNSGANGNYAVSGLQPASYQVCINVPGGSFLNPCQWDSARPAVTVAAGQQLTGVDVALPAGQKVDVRVDDPQRVLAANEAPGKSHLSVGVWASNGIFHPASIAVNDASGRTYSILVPLGANLRLGVSGHKLLMEDGAGMTVAESAPGVPFTSPTASAPSPVTFRYTAREVLP
jgi:hypothetical protein